MCIYVYIHIYIYIYILYPRPLTRSTAPTVRICTSTSEKQAANSKHQQMPKDALNLEACTAGFSVWCFRVEGSLNPAETEASSDQDKMTESFLRAFLTLLLPLCLSSSPLPPHPLSRKRGPDQNNGAPFQHFKPYNIC